MKPTTIKEARSVIRDAFEKDPYFKQTYVDNVAMYLFDNTTYLPFLEKGNRDIVAEGIIDLIFSE